MPSVTCPGKVFLLGEYAVLNGAPAFVGAIEPRFELATGGKAFPFAAGSPAGRLRASFPSSLGAHWAWHDPHAGRGGFGGSGAQFCLALRLLDPKATCETALRRFHALHASEEVPPSGADIAAQWTGGLVRYVKGEAARAADWGIDFSRVLLFTATDQAGRKVNTHEHLAKLGKAFFREYEKPLRALREILTEADRAFHPRLLTAYAETLFAAGLEVPSATEDRRALSLLPGVTAVKGTGAGLADALWVFLDDKNARESVRAAAEARGLRAVALDGWARGLSEDHR